MEDPAPKTYWGSAPLLILNGAYCLAFFLVGMSMVISYLQDPGSVGGVSGLALGIVAWTFSIWMTGGLAANGRLLVTSAGISVGRGRKMRRQMIPWESIKSFEIGTASRSPWPLVVVVLESERIPIKATAGFTSRVERMRRELDDARALYLAAGASSVDRDIASKTDD